MSDWNGVDFKRLSPVVTGTPQIGRQAPASPARQEQDGPSFSEVLGKKIEESGLTFSKHATQRAAQRGLDLGQHIERLSQGVRIAQEKGLDDTLILVDSAAFLVSARNATVITAMGGNDLRGNVFTNIDGTVII